MTTKVEKAIEFIGSLKMQPGELEKLATELNNFLNIKRASAALESPEFDIRALAQTRKDLVVRGYEDLIGEPIYTNVQYMGRWVLNMIGRLNNEYLDQVDGLKKGMIEMSIYGNQLADLLRNISYTVSHSAKARLIDDLEIIAQEEAGEPSLKAIAGELLKRLDKLDLVYKQYCGGLGLKDLEPNGWESVVKVHNGLEALIGTDRVSDNGESLQEAVKDIDAVCRRLIEARDARNKSKGKWAKADTDYKDCIRRYAAYVIDANPRLAGRNTAIGREVIKGIELEQTNRSLTQDESTALYNLKKWDEERRLPKEMYDLLPKTSSQLSEGIQPTG